MFPNKQQAKHWTESTDYVQLKPRYFEHSGEMKVVRNSGSLKKPIVDDSRTNLSEMVKNSME